jgi:hypothetical protein
MEISISATKTRLARDGCVLRADGSDPKPSFVRLLRRDGHTDRRSPAWPRASDVGVESLREVRLDDLMHYTEAQNAAYELPVHVPSHRDAANRERLQLFRPVISAVTFRAGGEIPLCHLPCTIGQCRQ